MPQVFVSDQGTRRFSASTEQKRKKKERKSGPRFPLLVFLSILCFHCNPPSSHSFHLSAVIDCFKDTPSPVKQPCSLSAASSLPSPSSTARSILPPFLGRSISSLSNNPTGTLPAHPFMSGSESSASSGHRRKWYVHRAQVRAPKNTPCL